MGRRDDVGEQTAAPAVGGPRPSSGKTRAQQRPAVSERLQAFTLAVGVTAAIVTALLLSIGVSPLVAYRELFVGAFGNAERLAETTIDATPLVLAGLGITIAFRCRLWNIGAEGQLYAGAIMATAVGISAIGIPTVLVLPLAIIAGIVGGAVWGSIPGFLKVRFRANEVLVTIMLNYVAILSANMVITGRWAHPIVPKTIDIQRSAWLPILWGPGRLHAGVLIAVVAAILTYLLLFRTVLGYEIRATGLNLKAARYAGMRVDRVTVTAFAMSGALAGLAGAVQILGVHHSLVDNFSPGYGFTAIVVALLGRLNPLWVLVSGYLMAALFRGSEWMQIAAGIPVAMVYVIEGTLVLIILGAGVIQLE